MSWAAPADEGDGSRTPWKPPYQGVGAFFTALDRLSGLTQPVVKLDLPTLSRLLGGSGFAYLTLRTFRELGLVDASGTVTLPLRRMIAEPDRRRDELRSLHARYYEPVLAAVRRGATRDQIVAMFASVYSGHTVERAHRFFVKLAEAVDAPLPDGARPQGRTSKRSKPAGVATPRPGQSSATAEQRYRMGEALVRIAEDVSTGQRAVSPDLISFLQAAQEFYDRL